MKIPETISFAYIAAWPTEGLAPGLESFVGEPCLVSFSASSKWVNPVEFILSHSTTMMNTPEGPVFIFLKRQGTTFHFILADALDERLWSLFDEWKKHGKYLSYLGMGGKSNLHACESPDVSRFQEFRDRAGPQNLNQFKEAVWEILNEDLLEGLAAGILRSEVDAYDIYNISVEMNVLDLDMDGASQVL
ncbi:hypothetical protein [Paraburkholderia sp. GAS42]|uniref:hypothetical protein n=1 Tax=Paraburkholderia sp. GAS42 TaxID=3035135 RepID=UPI003D1A0235